MVADIPDMFEMTYFVNRVAHAVKDLEELHSEGHGRTLSQNNQNLIRQMRKGVRRFYIYAFIYAVLVGWSLVKLSMGVFICKAGLWNTPTSLQGLEHLGCVPEGHLTTKINEVMNSPNVHCDAEEVTCWVDGPLG